MYSLNLAVANRVFIVEPQWNPSVENQAIARALRLGQTQAVLVTRYVVETSVEQVSKYLPARSNRVLTFIGYAKIARHKARDVEPSEEWVGRSSMQYYYFLSPCSDQIASLIKLITSSLHNHNLAGMYAHFCDTPSTFSICKRMKTPCAS
jgi:hypothetical protein